MQTPAAYRPLAVGAAIAAAPGLARGLSWAPDGSTIAFSASLNGTGEIYIANADGASSWKVTNDADDDFAPAFAPDGSIVFASDRQTGATRNDDLWRYHVHPAVGFTRLTNTPGTNETDPTVSKDGTRVAYALRGTGGSWSELRVGDANAANAISVWATLGQSYVLSAPTFSPDGKLVMATLTSYGTPGLVRTASNGSGGDTFLPTGYATPGWFN